MNEVLLQIVSISSSNLPTDSQKQAHSLANRNGSDLDLVCLRLGLALIRIAAWFFFHLWSFVIVSRGWDAR